MTHLQRERRIAWAAMLWTGVWVGVWRAFM
jgi:hypothetical protein